MQIKHISHESRTIMTIIHPRLSALALSAGVIFMLGCNRDQVSHATPVKTAPAAAPAAPGMPSGMPSGMPVGMPGAGMGAAPDGALPPPPRPAGHGELKWSVPKGWTLTPGTGMRFATLTPPGPGKAELAVVVLPGAAGGEPANVNRWRGQIGLAPLDDNALAGLRKTVKCKAGTVSLYDFTSEGQVQSRMISGLLATADGNTWFLKLTGEAGPVGKAKPEFMRFLETLHLD
jgi:hypothetical protein